MEEGLSPNHINLVGDFDEQVDDLLYNIRLSRQEVNDLQLLYDDLSSALETKWPDCQILLFGSIATGLGMKTSDVDCFVKVHPHVLDYGGSNLVKLARSVLQRKPHIFSELFAIPGARVPILKFFHIPTKKNCDINFTSPAGVKNSELIASLLSFDEMYLSLAVIIKHWSKVHQLTGTNLMTSYSLTLMVIFYLQQLNLLPPVRLLQNDCDAEQNGKWNTNFNNFNDMTNVDACDRSLYHLVGGFFKFYSTFDFDTNIISLYTGSVIPKKSFESLESVPYTFGLYKFYVRNGFCRPLPLDSTICIQDPFEHNCNTMRAVFPSLAARILALIRLGATAYDKNEVNDFLPYILEEMQPNLNCKKKKKKKNNNKKLNYVSINPHKFMHGRVTKHSHMHKNPNNAFYVRRRKANNKINRFS